jgi:hypothetical protein
MGYRLRGRKTTTRAFRIDETVDAQLREWAEREGVSVSFLAGKALRRLVEWDMYADRFGFIAIPKEALSRMLERLPEDEVRELGRWVGGNVYREFTTFVFKHFNLETVLQILPKLTSRYTKAFEYEEKRVGSRTVIVLRHSRGRKYSIYFEEIARALFVDFVGRGMRTESQENAVVLDIPSAGPLATDDGVSIGSRRSLPQTAEKSPRQRNVPS